MSNDYSLDELVQRFAISALSKERKDEALNEEIMVGKYTGEFFIKSKDGIVISTDVLNRLSASSNTAIEIAESIGMVGNLYHLEFDKLQMPCHIDYGVNIINSEPIDVDNCKSILLYIDYDEFDVIGQDVKPVYTNATVKLTIEFIDERGFVTEGYIEKSIQSINYSILEFDSSVTITGIEIIKDENVFNNNAVDRTIILHNIFMSVNI